MRDVSYSPPQADVRELIPIVARKLISFTDYQFPKRLTIGITLLKPVTHAKMKPAVPFFFFTRLRIQRNTVIQHNRADGGLKPQSESYAGE